MIRKDESAGQLAELASALEGAYTRVLDGLGTNSAVQFVGGRLQIEELGPRAEPPLITEFRAMIGQMLPRVDFPEPLLEVFDRTGLAADFTHISGADPAMEDFAVSLCGLLGAEACNAGLVPIEKPNVDLADAAVRPARESFLGEFGLHRGQEMRVSRTSASSSNCSRQVVPSTANTNCSAPASTYRASPWAVSCGVPPTTPFLV